jgi:predicted AlkP superfamily pyrophosphatase or phosphodiesterase
MNSRPGLVLAVLATLGTGCAGAPEILAPAGAADGAVTRHVIVVSVDGLRPDAIAHFGARNLTRMIQEGSASLTARTILPSKTLPAHTSMLTGAEPEVHGVFWNESEMDAHGYIETPTIFATAHAAGLRTAAFFSKSKFEHLAAPETLDHVRFPRGLGKDLASKTMDAVQAYLMRERPNLMFVHLADADYAGHTLGWMSRPYGWAVQAVDREIGELLLSADRAFGAGNYTVIVTADHGGHDRDHGTDDPRDVLIPWIAWGQGVEAGETLPDGIRTMDTAATALALLGLGVSEELAGTPVAAAFRGLPRAVVATATDEGGE